MVSEMCFFNIYMDTISRYPILSNTIIICICSNSMFCNNMTLHRRSTTIYMNMLMTPGIHQTFDTPLYTEFLGWYSVLSEISNAHMKCIHYSCIRVPLKPNPPRWPSSFQLCFFSLLPATFVWCCMECLWRTLSSSCMQLVIICVLIKIYKNHPEKWLQIAMKHVFSRVKQNVRKIENTYI